MATKIQSKQITKNTPLTNTRQKFFNKTKDLLTTNDIFLKSITPLRRKGHHILSELSNKVSSWIVGANHVFTHGASALLVTATHLGRGLPHDLGEVTSGFRVAWVVKVVLFDLIVPGVDGALVVVANCQVFTVRATRVHQVA